MIRQPDNQHTGTTADARANLEDLYELSPMQQGMLFHTLYSPTSGIYFEQSIFTIEGDFDHAAFQRAWQRVVNRHSILRTGLVWEGVEKPLQIVYRSINVLIEEQDWREFDGEQQDEMLEKFIRNDQARGFDLARPPLMRLALIRISNSVYKFIWSRHHLILDRWSRAIVLKEVFALYEAFCKDLEPELEEVRPYGDYIAWLLKQDPAAAESFWRRSLSGFENPTEMRIGYGSSNRQETYDQQSEQLSAEATSSLRRFAREQKLTMNTLVQGAWSLLLSRYSGESDVLFGATVAGRPAELAGVERMVGLFINTLPVRVQIPSQTSLLSWLRTLQENQAEQRQYEYSSLIDIQGWSDVPRGVPLFETILVFENLPVETSFRESKTDVVIRGDRAVGSKTNYPLTMLVNPQAELLISCVYDSTRFDSDSICRLLNHFLVLLEQFSEAGESPLAEISLLDSVERDLILNRWNETAAAYKDQVCLHQVFESQVSQTPDAVALKHKDQVINYAELNTRANKLARFLVARGVKPETVVGICMERSIEMVVGLLGILKAGGAYLPLDPAYPTERLRYMTCDSDLSILLTEKRFAERFEDTETQIMLWEQVQPALESRNGEDLNTEVISENLAYIMYTSGSTGQPKAVQALHRTTMNRCSWMWRRYAFAGREVCCQKTALSFGDSVWEIFGPLLQGVPSVIIPDEVLKDPESLVQTLAENQVSRLVLVPSLLRVLLESVEDIGRRLPSLKLWVTSGEALAVELAREFALKLPNSVLLNLYGSSEVAADVTCAEINGSDARVLIGRPIANTEIYILDSGKQPAPIGVPGDLYVGGANLARGYYNRPALTAEKFPPNPFGKRVGARLYHMGDVARYDAEGNIEFLGRRDHQVKIRGFRIETAEIESSLKQHSKVREAVVIAGDFAGEKRLIAYLVVQPDQTIKVNELRTHLQQSLPDYMIPSAFVVLEQLPLTPSGKIDRRQLPVPDDARPELGETYVAPRTPLEQEMARIWERVLKVKSVGIYDNFFALGGHSLLATQVISRVNESLQIELPLRMMFEQPTIAGLALVVAQRQALAVEGETLKLLDKLSQLTDEEAQQLLDSGNLAGI